MSTTKYIKDFLKLSGKTRNSYVLESNLMSKGLNTKQMKVLLSYFDFLKNSSFLKEVPYDFFINTSSYSEIMSKYNLSKINVSNKINRECKRLFDLFGIDLYEEIAKNNPSDRALNYYYDLLRELKIKYKKTKNKETSQLIIDLDEFIHSTVENKPEITEEDIIKITNKLNILSKPYLNLILKNMNSEQIGYIKYLLKTEDSKLKPEDIPIKNLVKKRLFLK